MAMFAMVFASCKKEPAPSVLESDPLDNGNPVAISLSAVAPAPEVTVKGSGAVTTWGGQKIKVLAYANNAWVFNQNTNDEAELTITAAGTAYQPTYTDQASNSLNYYYDPAHKYSFYGYYLDGATVETPTTDPSTGDSKVYTLTIDGTSDVMVAKADPTADVAKEAADETNTQITEANKTEMTGYAYSAYTARRGVVPNLVFSHVLTQLNFKVVAASTSAANVTIESLTLNKVSKKATLTVSGSSQGLSAPVAGEETDKFTFTPATKKLDATVGAELNVGQFLVIPAESFEFTLDLTSTSGTVTDVTQTVKAENVKRPTNATTITSFQPGESYDITIKLVGPEVVEVTAELTAWKQGGTWEYDTDQKPGQGQSQQ